MLDDPAPMLAVVYAKNLATVARFYEQTLHLERVEVEARHVLLRRGTLEVAIIQAPESVSASVAISNPPTLRVSTPLKLSFLVGDFERVREAAKATGGS